MEDLHKAGGVPALVKYLLKHSDLLDGNQLTVTGKTLAENYADVPELDFDSQRVVRRLEDPIQEVFAPPLPLSQTPMAHTCGCRQAT